MADETQPNHPEPSTPPPAASPVSYATPGQTDTGYPGPYAGPATSKDDQNLGVLTHILGILTGFLGPLIIWLVKKEESPFVDDQGKETLNFKLTMLIVYLAFGAFACITLGFGAILIPLPLIYEVIIGIVAALASSKGEAYRYPMTIRLVK